MATARRELDESLEGEPLPEDGDDSEFLQRDPQAKAPVKSVYDRLLEDTETPDELAAPPTEVTIERVEETAQQVTMSCDSCGNTAVYTFLACRRVTPCCSSTGC